MRHAIKMIGLVFVLGLSACDGEDGESFGRFVGTWRGTAGTVTTTCPGYGSGTEALYGNAIWSMGVSSDLVSMTALTDCPLLADATASTASGIPGQTCSQSDGVGGTSTVAFTGYTFVLSPDGRTATENSSGQITVVVEGAVVVCSFNETGSYQKISN
jgi:hypothetical protein